MIDAVPTTDFLGLPLADLSLDETVGRVVRMADASCFSYIVTPNVDHVVTLHRSDRARAFQAAYDGAALVLCDSRVLARFAKWSGRAVATVPGSDLTSALFARGVLAGRTVAIVGGGERLTEELAVLYPEPVYLQHRPPMGVLDDAAAMAAIIAFVVGARADVVLFAIGAPQSEIAALRCTDAGTARGVGLCVGASLEFLTADKQRAPRWMQQAGIEWLFRLASEPRRLWRRYLVKGPQVFAIWRQWERSIR